MRRNFHLQRICLALSFVLCVALSIATTAQVSFAFVIIAGDIDAADAESLSQLELGQTYESLDRLDDAEASYKKAAESNNPSTKQRALAALKQVAYKQDSVLNKYLYTPLRVALNAVMTALGTGLLIIVLVVIWLILRFPLKKPVNQVVNRYTKRRGKNKLRIGPITDLPKGGAGACFEHITSVVHGRIQTHFNPRKLIMARQRLPMLAGSQSADMAELMEAVLPGGVGKIFGWLLRKIDKPQFSINGVIQSNRLHRSVIFISLYDEDKPLKTWNKVSPIDNLIDDETELAFASLIRLVKHMNK